ncbi:sugar ABC transporter ATP-binding protein [Candidatus Uabimicrobium amorphum]|uniref:Xylose import ATP-binding protein XylG n=1 Tax=Uabimicrobium amorphum TaxID=2596890 RepID=A0A5S9F3L0_UABAM|nr:ATP-binding cassette domain-containing protein [Candidatus Uabimicrobium amorphum]BBM84608.1 xylose import ATP-binding protein XylG [Candidatus Uabimicrobium amorphum]
METLNFTAKNIVKKFPGVIALGGVNFELRAGEIHSICGENGAGKSTLIKVLSGIHAHGSYEGNLYLGDKPLILSSLKDAEQAGITVIYQELALIEDMTVAENIFLGREPTHNGIIDWHRIYNEAQQLLNQFHIDIDPTTRLGDLGVGQQQLVEIVKALGKKSRILILDEPTSALTEKEVEVLLSIVKNLRTQGISCVYISHKLEEVFDISDRITIIRDGQSITTLEAKKTNRDEVIHYMVGREIKDLFPRKKTSPGETLLKVSDLCVHDEEDKAALHDISLEVKAGEVLGIGGLMGSGRSELLLHIFGAWGKRRSGTVEIHGEPLQNHTPTQSIQKGLVMVSEDRKMYGLILEKDIGFNLSLSSLNSFSNMFLIDSAREFVANDKYFKSLRVKAPNLESIVENLSGGNQQKVVIGKALMTDPKIVFLDEPTRGIDVGAKLEVYELMNQLTEKGYAIIMISSELPELLGMSDRIMMLCEGRVGGTFVNENINQQQLMAAAMEAK